MKEKEKKLVVEDIFNDVEYVLDFRYKLKKILKVEVNEIEKEFFSKGFHVAKIYFKKYLMKEALKRIKNGEEQIEIRKFFGIKKEHLDKKFKLFKYS